MPTPSDVHVAVAKRLLHESTSAGEILGQGAAAGRVFGSLIQTLARIIGPAGTNALFIRALKLAKMQAPELEEVLVRGEPSAGSQQGVATAVERLCQLDSAACKAAAIAWLAVVLDLLANLIGDPLLRQILQKAFPPIDSTPMKGPV